MTARRLLAAALALIILAAPAAADAGLRTAPVIPPVQGAVAEHAREIATAGAALGNRVDVFAKVGDSITQSDSFLSELACSEPAWGRWTSLAATREHYGLRTFPSSYTAIWCDRANSFSRARMVHSGIGPDGIHPNLYGGCAPPLGCRAYDFTRRGLRYGYNQRNLGALRLLERVRAALGAT